MGHTGKRCGIIAGTLIGAVLISAGIVVGLVFGVFKSDSDPNLSEYVMYTDTKDVELVSSGDVQVYGFKDFIGNVQIIHAIRTSKTVYMFDDNLLTQIHSDNYSLTFSYNETTAQYDVLFSSNNESYEIKTNHQTPNITLPEFSVNIPMDTNISNPFTGLVIELQDSLSNLPIPDATIELNYYDEQNASRKIMMISLGDGRYFVPLPTNDSASNTLFNKGNLDNALAQQSDAIIKILQAYPMSDIFSQLPNMNQSFVNIILDEMGQKIPSVLQDVSKYTRHIKPRKQSNNGNMRDLHAVIRIPGENQFLISLNDVKIDPSDTTVVSQQLKTSKGRCNEQTVAGNDTPDDRIIDVGRGHFGIEFHYETYSVEDQIDVYYTNELVFSTGCVGTQGERVKPLALDDDNTRLRVKVTPDCAGGFGTQWYYAVQCPGQDLDCDWNICYCGYQRRPSQQLQPPSVDGCGTHRQKFTYWFIHAVGEAFGFTPACNDHDTCYGTCNSMKMSCDSYFFTEMINSCERTWISDERKHITCSLVADIFYTVVKFFGGKPFRNAQHEYCQCDSNSFIKSISPENITDPTRNIENRNRYVLRSLQ